MNVIHGAFFRSGWVITIVKVHTPASDPGIPDPPSERMTAPSHRHRLPVGHRVSSTSILGGLHHEYRLEPEA